MNATQLAMVNEVVEVHAGQISTHYLGCWKYHAGCLAFMLAELEDKA